MEGSLHGETGCPPELNFDFPKMCDMDPPYKKWDGEPVDILLLTVKNSELLSCYYFLSQDPHVYKSHVKSIGKVYFGKVGDDKENKLKVALINCFEGSNDPGASNSAVHAAVPELRPKAVICAGICCRSNEKKSKLGDVVISYKLTTYDHQKVSRDTPIDYRNVKTTVSKNMMNLIKNAADGWKAPLKDPNAFEVKVHCDGEILSGPLLVDDPKVHKQLANTFRTATALEMEGQGVHTAAFNLEIDWAVIKGISDLADGTKPQSTDDWQKFASAMAASVIFHMLKEPEALEGWPHYGSVQNPQVSTPQLSLNTSPPTNPFQEISKYLPDGSNGQIELWWRELHERLEKYYKEHLKYLLDRGFYDPHNELDRSLVAYLFVPLLQKELNVFKDSVWNTHRIRHKKETYLPDGVPNHVYEFPEEYGLEECGLKVTVEQLKEASIQSGILDEVDYLDENCRRRCEQLIPEPDEVKPKDCKDAYLYLKDKYQEQQQ